jgi:hypothetical protein
MPAKFWIALVAIWTIAITANASTQTHFTQIVSQAATVTTVLPSPSTNINGSSLPMTVGVAGSNHTLVSGGLVVLSDGATTVGSALLVNGSASFSEALVNVGQHTLTACYQGNQNFVASCSQPLTVAVLPPFTLRQTSPSGVVSGTSAFTDKLLVQPTSGFVGTIQLSCPTPSQGVECSISPSALTMGVGATAQAVTVSFSPLPSTALVFMPFLSVLCLSRGRGRSVARAVAVVVFSALVLGMVGCGAPVTIPYNPTSTGSYQLVVTGTSGTFAQSVSYQVSVK